MPNPFADPDVCNCVLSNLILNIVDKNPRTFSTAVIKEIKNWYRVCSGTKSAIDKPNYDFWKRVTTMVYGTETPQLGDNPKQNFVQLWERECAYKYGHVQLTGKEQDSHVKVFVMHAIKWDSTDSRARDLTTEELHEKTAFRRASEPLRADPEVVGYALFEWVSNLSYVAPAVLNDGTLLAKCIEQWGYWQKKVTISPQIPVSWLSDLINALRRVNAPAVDSLAFQVAVVKENGLALEHLGEAAQRTEEVAHQAVLKDLNAFEHVSEDLRGNVDLVRAMIDAHPYGSLMEAMPHIRAPANQNFELMLGVVVRHGMALKYLDPELRNDPNIVKAAIRSNARCLQYANARFRATKEYVEMAIERDGLALQYASKSFKNDFDLCWSAYCDNPRAKQYASLGVQIQIEEKVEALQARKRQKRQHRSVELNTIDIRSYQNNEDFDEFGAECSGGVMDHLSEPEEDLESDEDMADDSDNEGPVSSLHRFRATERDEDVELDD